MGLHNTSQFSPYLSVRARLPNFQRRDLGSDSSIRLLSGSVAVLLIALISLMRSLSDFDRLPSLYQPVSRTLAIGAGIALLVGLWRPSPWLLVLTLAAIHSVIWFFAFDRWLRLKDPNGAIP